jgi:16S rRNA (guanine527-N7)-methyltransferase
VFHVKQAANLPQLVEYGEILATRGIEQGLIGPRERDRLWQRHLLNCAVVAADYDLLPLDSDVIDVGSGAGLPGIVWALCRPDLRVVLVESLLRRSQFLTEVAAELEIAGRVQIIRGRAEELTELQADVVTARAVAQLPKLLLWLRPLMRANGQLVLLKGDKATTEVAAAAELAKSLGLAPAEICRIDDDGLDQATTVVRYQQQS